MTSYSQVHRRLRNERGRAAEYSCVACGGPASQWAYDYADPEQFGSPQGPYSVDLSHYQPMCASCHKSYDSRQAGRASCGTVAGYYRHRRTGDLPPCASCKEANNLASSRRARARRAAQPPKAPATECARGHAFNDSNTYVTPDGRRQCKECRRERKRRYRQAVALDREAAA